MLFKIFKNKIPLPFDYGILNENETLKGLIEFDGELHFKSVENFGGDKELEKVKVRNNIKTKYCEENKIPLLRIRYDQMDMIEEILKDFLSNPEKYIYNHSYNIEWKDYYLVA